MKTCIKFPLRLQCKPDSYIEIGGTILSGKKKKTLHRTVAKSKRTLLTKKKKSVHVRPLARTIDNVDFKPLQPQHGYCNALFDSYKRGQTLHNLNNLVVTYFAMIRIPQIISKSLEIDHIE